VVVFSDANSFFAPHTVRALVRNLADPAVGGVSGAKHVVASREGVVGSAATGAGEGLYWRYEAFLKRCDSAISAVMGVPGEVWGARREAFLPAEADSLIEDFVASMRMVGAGWRVVYEPEAVAYEVATPSLRAEWVRRTRIAAGGWQAFFQLRPALHRASPLVLWQYLSHRVLRWMVTPALFVTLLVANLALLASPFHAVALAMQVAFYALAGVGWFLAARGKRPRGALLPFYLCLLNAAALVGGWRYLRGKQPVLWARVR
jgi:cellulose synthase/poly-beta-1,6-N-acetylglucosamine synthase-like glycosyltransferase